MRKKQITFFDEENRYEKLTALGDPLEKLNKVIKWEKLRGKLTKACQKVESFNNKADIQSINRSGGIPDQ